MFKTLFLSVLLIPVIGCHKFCTPNAYSFEGGTSYVYPENDSVRVGDTILIKSSTPVILTHTVNPSSNPQSYDISGATNLLTDILLTTPIGINKQNGAVDSFLFFQVKGGLKSNPLDSSTAKTISYELNDNQYINEFGIIAQEKGVYFLYVSGIGGMKNCDKFSISIVNTNQDNHLHYLKDTYYGGAPVPSLDSVNGYFFKVY